MSRPASTSTRPAASPLPKALIGVNTQTKVLDSGHGRVICIADIRGRLSNLNDLAKEANAVAVIHTGDFGFFEASSLDRINDRTLRHLAMYSPLIPSAQRNQILAPDNQPGAIRQSVNISMLSDFPLLLSGKIKLQVPVYTTWGACEDVQVLEKFRSGAYSIENLNIIDEATTRCLDVGGIKLRILGLGGALVPHKMFDNGDGHATIAGGQGTMWTTALQIGELVDTAQRVFDPSETRLLVTHASPGREGIMAQLALVLKADLTISAGLHFRYATSYNEFSVQGDFEGFRRKLAAGKEQFDRVWESVKNQVDAVIDEHQRVLLDKALSVVERIPAIPPAGPGAPTTAATEEPAWKNCWNWNLCDAAYGTLVLDIREGRVSAELKSQGFNFAYRRTATVGGTPTSATSNLPNPITGQSSTKGAATPAKPPSVATSPPAVTSSASPAPGTPGKDTPKPNGTPEKPEKGKKQQKKDKKAGGATGTSTPDVASPKVALKSSVSSPIVNTPSPAQPSSSVTLPDVSRAGAEPDDLKSPLTDGSAGARTPKGSKPARNPYTIFMRMSVSANEAEIREFFGPAKDGITRVNYPSSFPGRSQKIAYIEFGDEEAMNAGLSQHAEKLKDTVPQVTRATDRESRGEPFHRGGGRGGRGGRGGFAARGFAAAGLTKRESEGPKSAGGDGPAASS